MSKQIERILICLLWLLAATLGTCFLLNTIFGFNMFSAQHWQYLAYLQAAQTPVRPAFYITFTCSVLVSLAVLYLLIRPRKAQYHHMEIDTTPDVQQPERNPEPIQPTEPAPTVDARPITPTLQRPPRIGIASSTPIMSQQPLPTTAQPQALNPTPSVVAPQPPVATSGINFDELRDIFASTGYVVKRSPQIGNFKPAVLAIGTNETLWIGGVGIEQSVLATAMERLATIFSDTLDDIQINIFGFIIAPTGATLNTDIQIFANTAQLRAYMESHKNTPPTDSGDKENFDAYSEYIDTVINYMDKT